MYADSKSEPKAPYIMACGGLLLLFSNWGLTRSLCLLETIPPEVALINEISLAGAFLFSMSTCAFFWNKRQQLKLQSHNHH